MQPIWGARSQSANTMIALLVLLLCCASSVAQSVEEAVIVSTCDELSAAVSRAPTNSSLLVLEIARDLTACTGEGSDGVHVAAGQNISVRSVGNQQIVFDVGRSQRHFRVDSGGVLAIENLLLRNGEAATSNGGGSVRNEGTLTATGCRFVSNFASGSGGGAIWNRGEFKAASCEFRECAARSEGGAVFNKGYFEASGCDFISNRENGGDGGAVFNAAWFVATDCRFLRNRAPMLGGAVFNAGVFSALGSTFLDNHGRQGGAVYDRYTLTATDCDFQGNSVHTSNGGSDIYVTIRQENFAVLRNCIFNTTENAPRVVGATANCARTGGACEPERPLCEAKANSGLEWGVKCSQACKNGKFGDGSSCFDCPKGKWARSQGRTEAEVCALCEPGKFGPEPGQEGASACLDCAEDTAGGGDRKWSAFGSPSCYYVCQMGEQIEDVAAGKCSRCPPGRYNSKIGGLLAPSGCRACGANHVCLGGAERSSCAAGKTSNPSGDGCVPCLAGSVRPFHAPACLPCSEGTYANIERTDCLPCQAGAYGEGEGHTNKTCSGLCPPGTRSSIYAKACSLCEIGKHTAAWGSETCQGCDSSHPNYLTSEFPGATECVCLPGKYNSSGGKCIPCSEGMNCSVAGVDVASLGLEDGFWRPSQSSTTVMRCPIAEACLPKGCAEGNEGVLCALCADGFFRPSPHEVCSECGLIDVFSFVGVLFLMTVAFGVFIVVNRRAPSGVLRPFINLVQSLTVMLMFDAPFPEPLVKVGRALASLTLGLEVASPRCAGLPGGYYAELVRTVFLLFIACLATMAAPLWSKFRQGWSWGELLVSQVAARGFRDLFVLVLLVHPTISAKAMEFFRCRTIDGVSYLMADYSVVCHTPNWYAFLPLIVVVFCCFSLGTPIAIVYVLRRQRDTLYREDGTPKPQPLDILYAIYQPRAYYYEAVQMFFKLSLWSALVFFDYGTEMQLAAALVINVLQLCIHLIVMPMGGVHGVLLNRMQAATLVLTAQVYINFGAFAMNFLLLAKRLAEFTDPTSAHEYDPSISLMGYAMQLLTFGVVAAFGIVAAKEAATKLRSALAKRRAQKRKNSEGMEEEAAAPGVEMGVISPTPECRHQRTVSCL